MGSIADTTVRQEIANGVDTPNGINIPMHNAPAFTPTRKLRVVTIGAGYSGMIFAHKLQYTHAEEFADLVEHTIFESGSEVGGTWVGWWSRLAFVIRPADARQ
jgi:hypothetical protein